MHFAVADRLGEETGIEATDHGRTIGVLTRIGDVTTREGSQNYESPDGQIKTKIEVTFEGHDKNG